MSKFCFDDVKMMAVLAMAVSLFVEYQTVHGLGEELATKKAVDEVLLALEAELEMVSRGDVRPEEAELLVVKC